jgi:ABC-type branched-subunit amino acid transport system permease subunit
MIGSVWFLYIGQVQPNTGFDPLFDLTIVLMAFLGGYGSIAGTVLGALIVEPVTLWLNTQPEFSGGYLSEILLGGVFLIVVLFMPRGIVPTGGEWITRLRSRGRPAVIPATTIGGPKAAGSVSATSIGSGSSGGAR